MEILFAVVETALRHSQPVDGLSLAWVVSGTYAATDSSIDQSALSSPVPYPMWLRVRGTTPARSHFQQEPSSPKQLDALAITSTCVMARPAALTEFHQ